MIKVAALTSGRAVPSTRYRIRQYIPKLINLGIEVLEYCPRISKWQSVPGKPEKWSNRSILPAYALWQCIKLSTRMPGLISSYVSDITWLSRQLLPGYLTFEPLLKKPLVFDVDDAIWLTTPFGRSSVAATARRSDIVFAGNDYLADWFSHYSKNVSVIPTAVDTSIYRPSENRNVLSNRFMIGWVGTSSNLKYLEEFEDSLDKFLLQTPNAVMVIVCDRRPLFKKIADDRVIYVPWSEEAQIENLSRMHVGIMPLPDNDLTRGKCSFKMLQYMACGLPVVVSPVGMNNEIIKMSNIGFSAKDTDDWVESLSFLYENRSEAMLMGRNGRAVVEQYFDQSIIVQRIASEFKRLA
jgi:glycosyltransferase involved in cell wall biosynthesis